MTPRKCKQLAHEYIDAQLAKNPKWLDSITDSWYYESGAWFEEYVKVHEHITIYSDSVIIRPILKAVLTFSIPK